MKKLGLIAIVFLFTVSLCACGRKEEPAPTNPELNTQPATVAPTIMPEIDPTLDTNIPDPSVNGNSQGMGTDETDSSQNANISNNTTPSNSIENSDVGTDNNLNSLDNAARSRMFQH